MFAKKLPLALDCRQNKYSHKYIRYIFFNFGHGICGSFHMLSPKAPGSCCKKNVNQFLVHCTSMVMSSKKVSPIFKILFKTGELNISVLHGVFFSRYVPLKSSISDEKNIRGEI